MSPSAQKLNFYTPLKKDSSTVGSWKECENMWFNVQRKIYLVYLVKIISVWNGAIFQKMDQLLEGYQLLAGDCIMGSRIKRTVPPPPKKKNWELHACKFSVENFYLYALKKSCVEGSPSSPWLVLLAFKQASFCALIFFYFHYKYKNVYMLF